MLKLSPICQRCDKKSCKIHVCSHLSSMPPFWIGFHCKKSLQASESLFVYPLLGRHLSQTSGFSKICFWDLGRSFQNKYGVSEGNSVRITETTSQTSQRDKNIAQKDRWMGKDPNNRPVLTQRHRSLPVKEHILAPPFLFLCSYFVLQSVFP